MLKRVLSFCILMLAPQVFGQSPLVSEIIPPSPQAASVFKFTEIPVSLYTGTANITIPLFEIETRGLTVPVSISYHSRGVRVDEIASHVGTGWNLSYGGLVSRQIRGGADEGPGGYLIDNWSEDIFTNSAKRFAALNDEFPIDRIPDQYYFNVNGQSGKFVFDYRTGKTLVQQFGNAKVRGYDNIIDGSGNVFSFGQTGSETVVDSWRFRENVSNDLNPVVTIYNSSWYLSTIKTPQNGLITYTYANDQTSFMRRSYDKAEYQQQGFSGTWHDFSYGSKIVSDQKRVEKIEYEKGSLIFAYGDRDDVEGGKFLSSISQYAKTSFPGSGSPTVKLIKKVKFEYEYTEGDESNVLAFYPLKDPQSSKRLFLKSVQVQTSDDTLPKYRFEYNQIVLPNRNSNSQDYWGYYNGKSNGSFLKDTYGDLNQNRTVDSDFTQAGILEKMIYPDGGSVKFTYEPNIGVAAFPPDVYYPSPNPVLNDDMIVSHLDARIWRDSIRTRTDTIYDPVTKKFSKYFKVRGVVVAESTKKKIPCVVYSNEFSSQYPENNGNNNDTTCKVLFFITKKVTTGAVPQWDLVASLPPGEGGIIDLPAGDYRLNASPQGNFDPLVYSFSASVRWKYQMVENGINDFMHADGEEVLYQGKIILGPGNRIKKIEYDDSNGKVLTKTYDYKYGNVTSGRIFGLPSFRTIKATIGASSMVFGTFPMGGGSPFSTYQGNEIGYGRVTEYIGERNASSSQSEAIGASTTLGKTEYEFTMHTDSGQYYEFPYHPPTDNEWLRGKVRFQKDFKSVDDEFKLIRLVQNNYIYAGDTGISGTAPTAFRPLTIRNTIDQDIDATGFYEWDHKFFKLPICTLAPTLNGQPQSPTNPITYKVYYLTGGTMDLKSTTTTDYFDNGTEMQSETKYFYDYLHHYNTASIENKTSDNKTLTTKYFYANSPGISNEPWTSALRDKNLVDIPLITQSLLGEDLLSSQKTVYKNWGTVTHPQLALDFIQASKADKPFETKVEYVDVDPSNGNPRELRQPNGMSVAYIWGYKKLYPIAKIEGATYAQVQPYEANLQALSDGTNEAALVGALKDLRALFPDASVTTLTYENHIGIKTVTAPNGYRMTYEYDEFNRLKHVKDHTGNILSENEYYYAPQN